MGCEHFLQVRLSVVILLKETLKPGRLSANVLDFDAQQLLGYVSHALEHGGFPLQVLVYQYVRPLSLWAKADSLIFNESDEGPGRVVLLELLPELAHEFDCRFHIAIVQRQSISVGLYHGPCLEYALLLLL